MESLYLFTTKADIQYYMFCYLLIQGLKEKKKITEDVK